jgi:hypothetical protein
MAFPFKKCLTTGEIEMNDINWEQIRKGHFSLSGPDEYRIPCADIQTTTEMLNAIGGGRRSWNETIGDYVGITKNHPLWTDICKMKS